MDRWHAFGRSRIAENRQAQPISKLDLFKPSHRAAGVVVVLLFVATAVPVHAQETRAEIIQRQRAEKAGQVQPHQPTKLEKTLLWVERRNPLDMLAPYNGFFIEYGYTRKPIGSGIAFSGGWRHDVFDRRARVELEVGQSFRNYNMVRADFSLPYLADERFEVGIEGNYYRHPQEDFYGMGFSTQKADRTSFKYEAPGVEGRAVIKPVPWLRGGVRVGYLDVNIGSGTDDRYPSTEQIFDDEVAPGLEQQPSYLTTELFAIADTRDSRGNPRAGHLLSARWRHHADRELDRYTFASLDLEAQMFVPVFDKKRVFAVRSLLLTTTAGSGQEVPFYFRPTLGGADTLRSYADFRFRDRNVFVLNAEYRWEAFSGLDMALFADAGEVAPAYKMLDVGDLKGAYGIGFRFNTKDAVFVRFDIAAGGSEGIRMVFKYSGNF